ncbi:hypothetical protein OBK22_09350 [Empedobacter falsenii]|uniref:hypothetical protein n=1 Tax=unclassified Empedobacter TaxID=2643773 RepID=UPI002575BDEB|nr:MULTISPECIES: hypothetical protein [unclassified Empedobacter]MDM1523270.1 hypothetical protein [Empedobacter sp. 225-1]MDM1542517.1 hypothetical protein [Empedobacter sp. 189-2]
MIKNVQEFNRLFQLYQKDNRFNLYINDYPKNEFAIQFYSDEIEDLNLEYVDSTTNSVRKIQDYRAKLNDYFRPEELITLEVISISGYFRRYDFYFYTNEKTFIFNFIHRDFLSQLIDILLSELDCNFISRLKTELLINLEYE